MPSPPCDAALEAAVKAEEEKTKKKAPYFGASSQKDALALGAWKRIGKAWKDRAPITCWNVYVARYGNVRPDGYVKGRYTAEAKAAMLSGECDALLKKAAGRCFQLYEYDLFLKTHKFVKGVSKETVQSRLKALGYRKCAETWAAELDDELDAKEKKYVDLSFFDCDGDKCTITRIDFYEDSPTPLEPVAWCAVEGHPGETPVALAEVDDYIAGREPPEPEAPPEPTPPPPLPEPPKPPPPPRTRTQKRAAEIRAARSENAQQVNKKARKKAATDAAAAKAEAKKDAPEPDDDEFTKWTPNVKAPPAQFDKRACRALLDRGASLVDTTKASTPVERAINAYAMKKPPKGGAEPEPPGELTRITGVGFRIQGDRDGAIIGRVSDWLRKRIFNIRVESFDRNGQRTIYLAPDVPVNRKRVGAAGFFLYGPNGGRLSDQTLAVLRYFKRAARDASGQLKDDLNWFGEFLVRGAKAGCVLAEFAFYPAGQEGLVHEDDEESELLVQHDHLEYGLPKGALKCGPVTLRAALSCVGGRSMSIFDIDGHLVTIPRVGGRGVLFVDGAHTKQRGIVKHRNDAGDAPGATLIVTLRRHRTSAFDHMSEAQRLFAQTGIALFH